MPIFRSIFNNFLQSHRSANDLKRFGQVFVLILVSIVWLIAQPSVARAAEFKHSSTSGATLQPCADLLENSSPKLIMGAAYELLKDLTVMIDSPGQGRFGPNYISEIDKILNLKAQLENVFAATGGIPPSTLQTLDATAFSSTVTWLQSFFRNQRATWQAATNWTRSTFTPSGVLLSGSPELDASVVPKNPLNGNPIFSAAHYNNLPPRATALSLDQHRQMFFAFWRLANIDLPQQIITMASDYTDRLLNVGTLSYAQLLILTQYFDVVSSVMLFTNSHDTLLNDREKLRKAMQTDNVSALYQNALQVSRILPIPTTLPLGPVELTVMSVLGVAPVGLTDRLSSFDGVSRRDPHDFKTHDDLHLKQRADLKNFNPDRMISRVGLYRNFLIYRATIFNLEHGSTLVDLLDLIYFTMAHEVCLNIDSAADVLRSATSVTGAHYGSLLEYILRILPVRLVAYDYVEFLHDPALRAEVLMASNDPHRRIPVLLKRSANLFVAFMKAEAAKESGTPKSYSD